MMKHFKIHTRVDFYFEGDLFSYSYKPFLYLLYSRQHQCLQVLYMLDPGPAAEHQVQLLGGVWLYPGAGNLTKQSRHKY